MAKPKISVITTAYHHEKTIQRAIDSVKMQDFKDYEHIIIDDTHTNNGMLATYYKALQQVKGEYITFLDADDYIVWKHKFSEYVEYMDANPDCGFCLSLVFTEINGVLHPMTISGDEVIKNLSFDTLLMGKANIYAQSYFIRKSVFDKYIDFSKFLKFNVWDYPIILELIHRTRFHCLNVHTSVFVKNTESVTQTRSRLKRAKYVFGNYRIKFYYILKYGCKFSTILYLVYKIARDCYSVIFKRW